MSNRGKRTVWTKYLKYFIPTMESGHLPRQEARFYQEMGREINNARSKSNHAEMEDVVQMKDELEIKEQGIQTHYRQD